MGQTNTFHPLFDAAPDAMILVDRDGRVTALNLEAEETFGCTEAEVLGQSMSRFFPSRYHWLLGTILPNDERSPTAASKGGTVACFAQGCDGHEFPVELARRPIGQSDAGQSLVTLRDLTQWRRAQETRTRINEEARATLESMGDAVVTTDTEARVTYFNPVAERVTGWSAREALGQPVDVVLTLISELSRLPVASTVARCLEAGRAVDMEPGVLLLRRDGIEIPIGDSAAPIRDSIGKIIGAVLVIQDESEQRRVGQRLSFEASHDVLTGLTNRREFERQLAHLLAASRVEDSNHVVLYIDLDHFKLVNDNAGHDAGDALLQLLGPLVSRHLRKRDVLARLGGDEFGILLENCPEVEGKRIAEGIRAEVAAFRFEWHGTEFAISASIGMTRVIDRTVSVAEVMRAADAACYAAKEGGGNRVHHETAARPREEFVQSRSRRITRLARAADEGHFEFYAQEIVPIQPDLKSRTRLEILLRLPDQNGGLQTAAEFLPQAERYRLMPEIDRWVVRKTIALLGQWHRDHPGNEPPLWSVNLSPSALEDDRLLPAVEAQLARHEVPRGAICFELSETAVLANLPQAVRFHAAVRDIGCEMALEDVGSNVTSFTYLKALPVNYLKIGGAFVQRVLDDPIYGGIVSAVAQIGRSVGIHTVAKDVGDAALVPKLRALGVGYAQGRALTAPEPLLDHLGRVALPRRSPEPAALRLLDATGR